MRVSMTVLTLPRRRPATLRPCPIPRTAAAVVDLLGVLAYGELSAFERLCADARSRPDAGRQGRGRRRWRVRSSATSSCCGSGWPSSGVDAEDAMRPFVAPLDAFHASTAPADWLEGLVKAYVGRRDRRRLLPGDLGAARRRDPRSWCSRSSLTPGTPSSSSARCARAIEADPRVAGRLALWGRRLMGEALSQAQRVAAERDALAGLLAGGAGDGGMDLVELGRMFTRITEQHTKRMAALGLSA